MNGAAHLVIAFVDVLSAQQVRSTLRHDAPNVALAVLFVALGVTAVAVYRLRTRSRDPAVLWFGLFALLFGVRLLMLADTVRFTVGGPERLWFYLAASISYTIPLTALLFLQEIFPAWRHVIRWLLWFQWVFAGTGLVCDQLLGRPESLRVVNSALMLIAFLALIVALFRQSRSHTSIQELRIGALAFSLTVVLRNLSNLNLSVRRFDLEPFGFAVFLAALGGVVVRRILGREEQLLALNKELEVARRIQQSILPRQIPALLRLDIAARYVPATAVAGDFYDFLCVDSRRLGILVADVSGHGVPAALIASMVKVAISAQIDHADDPAAVLTGMNQTLCGNLQGQFVTAAYLFLDLEGGRIRYGAAGHPPLLWWRHADQQIETVLENGLVLGLMAKTDYTFTERPISAGDRFLIYTDGLIEATDANDEQFGVERLERTLMRSPGLSADQVADSLLLDLERWAGYAEGRSQEDDVTVLIVDMSSTQ